MAHIPCEACRYNLGAGCCRINVEKECREGGGYELWEHCAPEMPATDMTDTETPVHRWTRRIVIGLLLFELGCITGRFLLPWIVEVIW